MEETHQDMAPEVVVEQLAEAAGMGQAGTFGFFTGAQTEC
jgi:hypothetical protein